MKRSNACLILPPEQNIPTQMFGTGSEQDTRDDFSVEEDTAVYSTTSTSVPQAAPYEHSSFVTNTNRHSLVALAKLGYRAQMC